MTTTHTLKYYARPGTGIYCGWEVMRREDSCEAFVSLCCDEWEAKTIARALNLEHFKRTYANED